jgi:hypothetical protein
VTQVGRQMENTSKLKRQDPDGGFVNGTATPLLLRIYGPLNDPAEYSLSTGIFCFATVNAVVDGAFGLLYAAGEQ